MSKKPILQRLENYKYFEKILPGLVKAVKEKITDKTINDNLKVS